MMSADRPGPPLGATFGERELVQRGRLASVIMLMVLCLWLASTPVGLATSNAGHIWVVFAVGLVGIGLALLLNRKGWVTATGLLLIVMVDIGFAFFAWRSGNSLDARAGTFTLLVASEILAAALLNPYAVFFIAATNAALMVGVLYLPGATDASMAELGSSVAIYRAVVVPIILQLLVALVAFLWARSTSNAIRRADRAEDLTTARATIERQAQERMSYTYALDEGNQRVEATIVRFLNGDASARCRIPLGHPMRAGTHVDMLLSRVE
jgi:hypothetical protein